MTVSGYAKDVLVSADWAKAHLDDPSIRFVEVDVDTTAYDQSHIPGAVGWNWTSQLADGVRRDIASREEFSALLSQGGIGPDTQIVLYGDNNNWFAAWAYWQLKLYGHRERQAAQRRPQVLARQQPAAVDRRARPTRRAATELPEVDYSLRAFRDDILPRLGDEGLALVDVRSPAEFAGEVIAPPGMTETAQRAGHIPGAASIPWATRSTRTGRSSPPTSSRRCTRQGRHAATSDIIAYCRIGERSSPLSWFVLHELLGFSRVRNYDGSWTEWGSHGRRADREGSGGRGRRLTDPRTTDTAPGIVPAPFRFPAGPRCGTVVAMARAAASTSPETDLYEPVKRLLAGQGYDVKGEIQGCDVVGVRGDEPPVVVELKRVFGLAVVIQGIDRLAMTDAVYVAVGAWPRQLAESRRLCRRVGLGLIVVADGRAEVLEDPVPYRPRRNARRVGRLLREHARRVGDPRRADRRGSRS